MVASHALKQISEYEWEIPQTYRETMRAPVRVLASRQLIEAVTRDKSLDQAINAAALPGLAGKVVVMPDMHQGYGFPIGGVAATRYPEGVISPGGIGYDINCGVRLLSSQIPYQAAKPHLSDLASALNQHCPSGLGKGSGLNLSVSALEEVCATGSAWALKKGYATKADLRRTEDGGRLSGANPEKLSQRAKKRGRSQVGSLGSGNHFVEVNLVAEIFDAQAAQVMGLRKGHLALQIHSGSRGFGHQVCSDYVRILQGAVQRYGIDLPDRALVCAPMDSPEGRDYLAAMRCAANYAFANRQTLAHFARQAFEQVFAGKLKNWHLHQVYDVAHNIGKIETHNLDGVPTQVCVHRKGATRAFGPGADDLPGEYRAMGQPVLVPGSMGTASWVLRGTEKSMEYSWGSSCHGAGRTMSRSQAKKKVWGEDLRKELTRDGIQVRARSMAGLAEEAPVAYKDVNAVVDTVVQMGIAEKVALLKPLAVIKG